MRPGGLTGQLDGLRILGLPLQVVESEGLPSASAPALFLKVILTDAEERRDPRSRLSSARAPSANAWLAAGQGLVP